MSFKKQLLWIYLWWSKPWNLTLKSHFSKTIDGFKGNTHIHSFFDMCHRYWISALVCIIIVVKTKLTFLVTQSDFACYTVLCTSRQKSISPRQMVCIDIIIIGLSVAKGVPVTCSVFLAPFSNWGSTSAGRNPKVPKTVSQKAHSPPHVHLQGPLHNKF